MFQVLIYTSPLLILTAFFVCVFFLLEGFAKFFIFIYIFWLMIIPFILLFREEVKIKKRSETEEEIW